MMKNLAVVLLTHFVSLATVSGAFAEDGKNFTISSSVRLRPVSIEKLTVSSLKQEVSKDKSGLQSWISFSVSGNYDAGWCGVESLVLKNTPTKGSEFDPAEEASLEVYGVNDFAGANDRDGLVALSDQACAFGDSGAFTLPMKLEVVGGIKKSHAWKYVMKTGFNGQGDLQIINVTFTIGKGWSLTSSTQKAVPAPAPAPAR